MIDFSLYQEEFNFLKKEGGILILDTQNNFDMAKINNDDYYDGIFSKVDAYEELVKEFAFKDYKVVLVETGIDQILLYKYRHKIEDFLDRGGIFISFAANFLEWLPGNMLYKESKYPIKDRVIQTNGHEITRGVKDYDITYRRGVCGFFTRGYFDPPKKSEIFLKDNFNQCVAYIDYDTTSGVIVSTAGADLFNYGLFEQSTAKRMGFNFLLWLSKTIKNSKLKGSE